MAHTKKVGITGKYGNRTGKKIREKLKEIYHAQKNSKCPECDKKLKRVSLGIWICERCNLKFTGGAHSPKK